MMSRKTLFVLAITPLLTFAQTSEVVSIGPGYTEQVWYDLETGNEYSHTANDWDIAFEVHGISASIITNSQKTGLRLYEAPYSTADWYNIDTLGISAWSQPLNSPTDWSFGAFNHGKNPADTFDLGWGNYDFITHASTGDSCYVIQLANGQFKKLKIDGLAGGIYFFTHANLDGTNEVMQTADKATFLDKGFIYYSIENDLIIDREPPNTDWDLTFVRYTDFVPIEYNVAGVLLNKFETECEEVAGIPLTQAQYSGQTITERNTIGWNWKNFNNTTFQWEISDSLTYYVDTQEGNVFKLVFTDFGGGATGEYFFDVYPESVVGIEENDVQSLAVYPNPATETLNIVTDGLGGLLEIRDMAGRIALQERIVKGSQGHTTNTSFLRSGLYMVGLTSDTGFRSTLLKVE